MASFGCGLVGDVLQAGQDSRTGAISDREAEEWVAEQDRRAADGRLTLAIPRFLAAGPR